MSNFDQHHQHQKENQWKHGVRPNSHPSYYIVCTKWYTFYVCYMSFYTYCPTHIVVYATQYAQFDVVCNFDNLYSMVVCVFRCTQCLLEIKISQNSSGV